MENFIFCAVWIGYFYQCWKCIDISWMIVGNYTKYTKSYFYEIVNVR